MRDNIEAERARAHLTKEQLAKKIGITTKTYLSYIRGGPMPIQKVIELCTMFNCSADYLLGLSDQRKLPFA